MKAIHDGKVREGNGGDIDENISVSVTRDNEGGEREREGGGEKKRSRSASIENLALTKRALIRMHM